MSGLRQVALLAALVALHPAVGWSWNGDVIAVAADTTIDLDGDGQREWIQLTWLASDPNTDIRFDKVVIDVNGHLLAARGTAMNSRIYIIDLVADDHRQEISITEEGPSDDPATHVYAYALGSIRELGMLPDHVTGPPRVDGSGKIETRCRGRILQTWHYPCTYSVNRYTLGFERVPEDYYVMDTPVTLKIDLPIVNDPEIQGSVGIIRAGSTARIIGSDDVAWCEIESSDGLRGWFQVISYSRVAVDGGWEEASDVFDGLFMAA